VPPDCASSSSTGGGGVARAVRSSRLIAAISPSVHRIFES
jgi:hypothetical protein